MKKKCVILIMSFLVAFLASCQKESNNQVRLDQLNLENESLKKEIVDTIELRKKIILLTETVSELKNKLIDNEHQLLASEHQLQDLPRQVKQKLRKFLADKHSGIWDCGCNANCIEPKTEIKSANVKQIIKALNMNLILKSINGNTIFIKQDNAKWPVNMGSSGALCILARVVFSLTSVKGIEYVDFEFDYGDHASPGRFCRLDFIDLWPLFN